MSEEKIDKRDGSFFFSVGIDLIPLKESLPFDLFVNSSALAERERFVRIFPKGGHLEKKDLQDFKAKYHQLYIPEDQREEYLKSLSKLKNVPDIKKTEVIKDSAIHYLNQIFDSEKEFTTEILNETIEGCRESVESMIDVVQDYKITDIQNLIGDLSFHDFYTYDHSINVSMYSISILKAIKPKASRSEMVMAGLGGLLHDLGKIKIPTNIINNPGKLTDDQFLQIKKHPDFGIDLLKDRKNDEDVDFDVIKRVVHEHHENVNGTGYPRGLKSDEIHLFAKITSIADFFDALTTKRSYHEVISTEDALGVMAKTVGKKIDQNLFEVFSKQVINIVHTGKGNFTVNDDFDPCQPHQDIPLVKLQPKKQNHNLFKKEAGFGKVKTNKNADKKDKKDAA